MLAHRERRKTTSKGESRHFETMLHGGNTMDPSEFEYVGFWPRVGAAIIDSILMMVVLTPLILVFFGPTYFSEASAAPGSVAFLIDWLLPALAILAFWIARQATPGKMLIGAKIVDAVTGEKPIPGQLVLRYIGYYVAMLPLFIGIIWVAFDRRKQGWHDKMGRTVVVRDRKKAPPLPA